MQRSEIRENKAKVIVDDIRIQMLANGQTANGFDNWIRDYSRGTGQPKNGTIELLSSNLQIVVGQINLFDLVPINFPFFQTGLNRRTINLHLGRFSMQ